MDEDDYRFSLSADKYLERHRVLVYIRDVIGQLLEHKDENTKVNTSKFFSEYFSSVRDGNHVLFREHSYVAATFHNRASFVRMVWKCFKHIGRKGELLSMTEYHALVRLLCADFPFEPIQKTARIILMEDALDSLIAFADFLYAFQTQFCYDDFLGKCAEVYNLLLNTPESPHTTVVVPTSDSSVPTDHGTDATMPAATSSGNDGIDSLQFYRALLQISEKLDIDAPPLPVLREILLNVKRVTFFGFLIALAKSEALNSAIGRLPGKAELFDVSEQDNESSVIRPSSPTTSKSRPRSAQSNIASSSTDISMETTKATSTSAGSGRKNVTSSSIQLISTAANTGMSQSNHLSFINPNSTQLTSLPAAANSNGTSHTKVAAPGGGNSKKVQPRRTRRQVLISDDDDDDDSGSDTP